MLAAKLEKIARSREKLSALTGGLPEIGVIAGTGLGDLAADLQIAGRAAYAEIGFPVSTVSSHAGELVWGEWRGRRVFVLRGRFHLYEGYAPDAIAMPIRALAQAGMKKLIITNAAGGLDLSYNIGDVMLIRDHINATGKSPLTGEHHDSWGERFPDMARVWDADAHLQNYAAAKKIPLHCGVYIGTHGPELDTPAESRMYKMLGAQAVGMSTVMEAIAAAQAGVKIVGLSAITNINNPDAQAVTSLAEIIAGAEKASGIMRELIGELVAGG
ncbi:purine nucleoside phosphorylase [Planctomycetales bacterium]|nr:purine nucleoside phosphorylase [Planctomycetales bacterium]